MAPLDRPTTTWPICSTRNWSPKRSISIKRIRPRRKSTNAHFSSWQLLVSFGHSCSLWCCPLSTKTMMINQLDWCTVLIYFCKKKTYCWALPDCGNFVCRMGLAPFISCSWPSFVIVMERLDRARRRRWRSEAEWEQREYFHWFKK